MGTVAFNTDVDKTVDINKNVNLDVNKFVNADVDINGNLATAEASADALGDNTLAETDTFAQATESGSFSFSESLAAVDGGEEPQVEIVPLNVAFVLDATGSTDEDWLGDFSEGRAIDGFIDTTDPEQNPTPSDPPNSVPGDVSEDGGEVIDGEIAIAKEYALDALASIAAFEAANPDQDIIFNFEVIKYFDGGANGGDGDASVLRFLDFGEDDLPALFTFLENTGSNGLTNLGTALVVAEDFFVDTDAEGDTDHIVYLNDNDNTTINNQPLIQDVLDPASADYLPNVAAASREAWIVPNAASDLEGDNPPGDAFNQLDDDGVEVALEVNAIDFGLV